MELDHFHPLPSQLEDTEPIDPLPLADTPLIMISKPEQVQELVADLQKETAIAVDLEVNAINPNILELIMTFLR